MRRGSRVTDDVATEIRDFTLADRRAERAAWGSPTGPDGCGCTCPHTGPGRTPRKPCSAPRWPPPPDRLFCPYQERPHVERPGRPAATTCPQSEAPHSSPISHSANAGRRIQAETSIHGDCARFRRARHDGSMTTEPTKAGQAAAGTKDLAVRMRSVLVGGEEVDFPRVGVTAVVGGNNVGKSTFLREINAWLAREPHVSPPANRCIVQDLTLEREGDKGALEDWLRRNANYVDTPRPGFVRLQASQPLNVENASHHWKQKTLGRLCSFFVHYSVALDRASMVEPVGQRTNIADPPQHPVHVLQDNATMLTAVDEVSREIFREPLTLDRLSGQTVLRVGATEVDAPPVDAVTAEYREALTRLPGLDVQGDGMRSLLGLLLPVITATYPIILIDEPEAFLHPPQAFQLGKTLATIAQERGIQVTLATHDRNMLAGLLAASASVSVVRLDRKGDTTTAHQLAASEVETLWTDPVMRYSNVLEGLFHRVVVVAEADPDCRFYAAAIDALDESSSLHLSPSEILFLPSGGKDGMARIVKALRAASVRVVACPDLDLLDDASKIEKLIAAFGGTWNEFEGDYHKAVHDLKATSVEATCEEVLSHMTSILGDVADQPWTEATKALIKPATRTRESGFQKLKRFGVATFSGQAATHAEALLNRLDNLGICCVREGELERLAPTLGVSKGSAWLPAALGNDAQRGEKAREQVQRILNSAQV